MNVAYEGKEEEQEQEKEKEKEERERIGSRHIIPFPLYSTTPITFCTPPDHLGSQRPPKISP